MEKPDTPSKRAMLVSNCNYFKFFRREYVSMSGVVWKPGKNEVPDGKFCVYYDLDAVSDNMLSLFDTLGYCAKVLQIHNTDVDVDTTFPFDLKTSNYIVLGKLMATPQRAVDARDFKAQILKAYSERAFIMDDATYIKNNIDFEARVRAYTRTLEAECTDESEVAYRIHEFRMLSTEDQELIIGTEKQKRIIGTEEPPSGAVCKICWVETELCVIVSCGHYTFCQQCLENVTKCPLCRIPITKLIKVFT